ncbi:uroporphyrinogen-III synthase [Halobacillus sp. Marseille-Q1614]|uniref:uroporphyrinogen-III synthase n=1 Tax=Halobacillus sp. Marseille-Q1614 TaxID=2709134 RepID=UPI0015714702|nr:uroporphyrinogen-III synthase [Halobacillus sp. Marseille-Q1614]
MSRPLEGKKILVTRALPQAEAFVHKLKSCAAEPLHIPLIKFQRHRSEKTEKILTDLHDYSWVFITSFNGVKFFFDWIKQLNVQIPPDLKWAVVGSKTEQALLEYKIQADFVPSSYHAEAMQSEFFSTYKEPGKILYIRGNLSKDVLPEAFVQQRILFDSLTVYDTLLVKESKEITEQLPYLDALTFTSPSTIEAFVKVVTSYENTAMKIPCFCIGPSTAEAAEAKGFHFIYVPQEYTVEGIIEKILEYFQKEG